MWCSGVNTGPRLCSEYPRGTGCSPPSSGTAQLCGYHASLPQLSTDIACCCYADSWHNSIVKSLRKFMISPSLPHPVFEQVIFEPEGISTHLVTRNEIHFPCQGPVQSGPCSFSFPAPLLTSFTPVPLVSNACNSPRPFPSQDPGTRNCLGPEALPTFTVPMTASSPCRSFPNSKSKISKEPSPPVSTPLHPTP